jgi:hypothetical protein
MEYKDIDPKVLERVVRKMTPRQPITNYEFIFWVYQFLAIHWKVSGVVEWGWGVVLAPIIAAISAAAISKIAS